MLTEITTEILLPKMHEFGEIFLMLWARVKRDFVGTDSCIPRVTDSYEARGSLRTLTDSKLAHLQQMYSNFIAEEKWPDFVKSLGSSTICKTSMVYCTFPCISVSKCMILI